MPDSALGGSPGGIAPQASDEPEVVGEPELARHPWLAELSRLRAEKKVAEALIQQWRKRAAEHRDDSEDGRAFEVERCMSELAAVLAARDPRP